MGVVVSFEEKNQWAYGLAALLVGSTYFAWLGAQIASAAHVEDIAYVRTLMWALGAGIVANIVFGAFARASSPGEADTADERDRNVGRRADQVTYIIFAVLIVGPFALAILDAPTFWIANAIYAAYVAAAVASVVARSVIYRKGA